METNHPPADSDHSFQYSRPLRRTWDGRMISGVASGLASYLDVEASMVRVVFVALALLGGIGLPAYAACWLLIPDEGADMSVAEDLLHQAEDLLHHRQTW